MRIEPLPGSLNDAEPPDAQFQRLPRTKPARLDRLPPHSLEAEQAALGCAILDKSLIDRLRPEYFYDLRHQNLAVVLYKMSCQCLPFDIVTIHNFLGDKIDEIGGDSYLAALPEQTPSAANFPYYEAILAEKYALRLAIRTATDILSRAYEFPDSQQPIDLLEDMEESIQHARQESGVPPEHNGHLPSITSGPDFMSEVIDLPQQIISGMLECGNKFEISGGSKTNKSWMALDIALSVASGLPWLGFETFPADVLFINFEIGRARFQRRVQAVCRAKGIAMPSRFHVWNLRGYACDYQTLLPRLSQKLRNTPFKLIIIDPLYKMLGDAVENSAEDMNKLFNTMEHEFCVKHALAVLFTHHFSKGNQAAKEAIDRPSGSGVLARDPDGILILTKLSTENCFQVSLTLRSYAPIPEFSVRYQYPLITRDDALDPQDLKLPSNLGRKPSFTDDQLFSLLPDEGLTTPEWFALAETTFRAKKSAFYDKRARLVRQQRVLPEKTSGKDKPVRQGTFPLPPKNQAAAVS